MSMYMYVPLCLYAQIYVPVGKIPPPARSKQEHKENRSNSKDQSTPPSVGATATPLQPPRLRRGPAESR